MLYRDQNVQPLPLFLEELGKRIERYRLSRQLRQEDVAEAAGVSRVTIRKLESGGGNVETLARVLRALGIGDRLLEIVPDATVSPLDEKTGSGKPRQRARRRSAVARKEPWKWGDE